VVPHLSCGTGFRDLPGHEELAGEWSSVGIVEDQAAGIRNPGTLGQYQGENHKGQDQQAMELHFYRYFQGTYSDSGTR